ncbi:double-stranded RNA-binding protein 1 isoform X3 [Medicago truncatula]|uniref:double-stranded RNA-binding protein 1 isoform X3 n=1 Tax=Medicago truncatula TaxID=3880 RepID=UPI0019676213|nr:double-stranded RNA-binding protein 1 isoform X3 [Medicago truncatula]
MSTTNEDFQVVGVSNCYVFKSQLQEYAQKAGLGTPVYETTKEGPSHEPSFRSTVIMNDVRYDSLAGFFNRKAAEQSAAEVALMELAKTGEVNQSITQPVHETGLCKNLLQEYAQKMNYAMPLYQSKKDDTPPGRAPLYSCTVDIGGMLYIGGTAKTKREAEIKAARTALLAIQTNASQASENQFGHLTVIPSRKRATESIADEASKAPKSKKSRFKGKYSKKKPHRNKKRRINADNAGDEAKIDNGAESLASANDESGLQEVKSEAAFPSEAMKNSENGASTNYHEKETSAGLQEVKSEAAFPPDEAMQNSENGVPTNHHEKETLGAIKEVKSEAAFPSDEAMQNSENGASTNHHEKETLAAIQEVKSEAAFPSDEAMQNSENGVSTNHHEKETLATIQEIKSEAAFPSDETMMNSENGVSTNHHEKETLAAIQEIKSEAAFPSDEATMNSENGVSTNHHEKETLAAIQEIKSEAAFLSEAMTNSENRVSTNHHEEEKLAGVQEIKSEAAFLSEVMKNSGSDISTNLHEKEMYQSFVLNNQENFESGKLTELQSKEINIGNVVTEVSFAPEGYILAMSVEMNKQNCNGDMVSGE